MHADHWHEKWHKQDINFNQLTPNAFLTSHFKNLHLRENAAVFVPLCGKTIDISWLLSKRYRVVGSELSEIAVQQLFTELALEPTITDVRTDLGPIKLYGATGLDIFVGDILTLTAEQIGPINAIYDRAALVALPETMRNTYTQHLMQITAKAPQFLITYQYDQQRTKGPPFSIPEEEVLRHYQGHYHVKQCATVEVQGGIKGHCPGMEIAWLLNQKVSTTAKN